MSSIRRVKKQWKREQVRRMGKKAFKEQYGKVFSFTPWTVEVDFGVPVYASIPECKNCGAELFDMEQKNFCDPTCEHEYYYTNRTCTTCGGEFWDGGTSCTCDDFEDDEVL